MECQGVVSLRPCPKHTKWSMPAFRLVKRGRRPEQPITMGLRGQTTETSSAMTVDETKLNAFLGKAVGDLGAAISATLILVGDRLGLYRELAKGSLTPAELAQRTGTNERYIREWLGNQGAGGYVELDPSTG